MKLSRRTFFATTFAAVTAFVTATWPRKSITIDPKHIWTPETGWVEVEGSFDDFVEKWRDYDRLQQKKPFS